MPGGTGRLILPEAFCTAVVVVVVTLDGAIVTPDAPRRRAWASGRVLPLCSHRACYEDGPASRASVYACVAIAVGGPEAAENVNVGVAARVGWAVETIAQRGSAGAGPGEGGARVEWSAAMHEPAMKRTSAETRGERELDFASDVAVALKGRCEMCSDVEPD